MQIQLIGVPASGKSTLINGLLKRHPDIYVTGEKKYTSFKKVLIREPFLVIKTFWLCLPILPLCVLSLIKSDVGIVSKITAIVGLFLNLANYISMNKYYNQQNRVILWDELILQRALSIFAYSTIQPRKKNILKFVLWAKKVCSCVPVFIICESQSQERLVNRGVPVRMKNLSNETIQGIMNTQKKVVNMILQCSPGAIIVNSELTQEESLILLHNILVNRVANVTN